MTEAADRWSVYDALLDQISTARADGTRELLLRIEGMHCMNCLRNVERRLQPLARQVHVDLAAASAELVWDARSTPLSALLRAVEQAGFRPMPLSVQPGVADERQERRRLLLQLGIAGLLSMQVMMLAGTQYFVGADIEPALAGLMRWGQWIMATPVLLYSGLPFLRGAWKALRSRSLNMDVPVALALLLAYGASGVNTVAGRDPVYFDSVTMFVFLLLAARWFEGRGRAQAAERLRRTAAAQPLSALRETAGGREEVPAAELRVGDVMIVSPGAAAAADGLLLDASAAFDESLLSGESLPAAKAAGAPVYAGAVNCGSAPARARVSSIGAGTTLSQIQRLMHRAQQHKPAAQQLADRVAGWIVLGVLAAASAGAAWWWPVDPQLAFNVALGVLVVTCPCALSLATPLALAAASSQLAARGVLVARADALLRLPQIDTVCFDKTGTLTTGQMVCARIEPGAELDAPAALRIAAALERDIRHPIATAFADVDAPQAQDLRVLPGRGVQGRVDGRELRLVADDTAGGDLSWLRLEAADGALLARFGLQQRLRPQAAASLQRLAEQGLALELLSGDDLRVVEQTAVALGIERARGRLRPADKLAHVAALQQSGHRVWMVGDGINDAPVLAAAQVSTSFAAASALAQARADLLLMRDDLSLLPQTLAVARRTQRIVRENLIWAAAYNLVAVPLALSGALTPWLAALGMGLSSVTVVLNALRLARSPRDGARAAADPHALIGSPS